ncbi:MarR family winged helix-turn-helix transcriptional regulator [Parasedimentitalea psychrophila]|uniref:MarR family transcriptional regulator n=1 Tax=Parasedimentitalea psychrophila TaxID=2997337 RepID=A0A9Y2KYY3_9RHOB|nr:MarR family transcriptional regulator [Parasedimentitalea psychrophila]WIY24322.1 MarR family transcriptional regulator [Parasedimentitalea psychrophila]
MDQVDRIVAQWNSARPDLDVGPMETIGRLYRLAAMLRSEMEKTWKAYGLNPASFDVLATLRRSGKPDGLSPGELLDLTMVTSGTMTNRVDQLVKGGLVARVPNPEDKRGFLIRLTEDGMTKIEAAVTDHVKTQHRLMDGFSHKQRGELNDLLRMLTGLVETDAD